MNNYLPVEIDVENVTEIGFSFDQEKLYSENRLLNFIEKKYPKNILTSSTTFSLDSEDEKKIYEALDDIKKGRIFELSEDEDIIDSLSN